MMAASGGGKQLTPEDEERTRKTPQTKKIGNEMSKHEQSSQLEHLCDSGAIETANEALLKVSEILEWKSFAEGCGCEFVKQVDNIRTALDREIEGLLLFRDTDGNVCLSHTFYNEPHVSLAKKCVSTICKEASGCRFSFKYTETKGKKQVVIENVELSHNFQVFEIPKGGLDIVLGEKGATQSIKLTRAFIAVHRFAMSRKKLTGKELAVARGDAGEILESEEDATNIEVEFEEIDGEREEEEEASFSSSEFDSQRYPQEFVDLLEEMPPEDGFVEKWKKDVALSVVKVRASETPLPADEEKRKEAKVTRGSGFLLFDKGTKASFLITNHHVLKDELSVKSCKLASQTHETKTHIGDTATSRFLEIAGLDLSIVCIPPEKVDELKVAPVEFGSHAPPEKMMKIAVFGHCHGGPLRVSYGEIKQIFPADGVFVHSCATTEGSSGGLVVALPDSQETEAEESSVRLETRAVPIGIHFLAKKSKDSNPRGYALAFDGWSDDLFARLYSTEISIRDELVTMALGLELHDPVSEIDAKFDALRTLHFREERTVRQVLDYGFYYSSPLNPSHMLHDRPKLYEKVARQWRALCEQYVTLINDTGTDGWVDIHGPFAKLGWVLEHDDDMLPLPALQYRSSIWIPDLRDGKEI